MLILLSRTVSSSVHQWSRSAGAASPASTASMTGITLSVAGIGSPFGEEVLDLALTGSCVGNVLGCQHGGDGGGRGAHGLSALGGAHGGRCGGETAAVFNLDLLKDRGIRGEGGGVHSDGGPVAVLIRWRYEVPGTAIQLTDRVEGPWSEGVGGQAGVRQIADHLVAWIV